MVCRVCPGGLITLFRDIFAGIDPDLDTQVEFGMFQKVGDPTTRNKQSDRHYYGIFDLFYLTWKRKQLPTFP
jgi:hypothetical protein